MKNLGKTLTLTLVILIGFTLNSFAQVTGSADAQATVVTPISIVKDADMNFGNIAVQSGTGGAVVISPIGVRTPSGGVTLPATTGSPASAAFTISGVDGYTYAITLPGGDVIVEEAGTNQQMTINTFTSSPSGTGTLTGGSEVLTIGATLNVSAGQLAAVYNQTSTVDVIVNYN